MPTIFFNTSHLYSSLGSSEMFAGSDRRSVQLWPWSITAAIQTQFTSTWHKLRSPLQSGTFLKGKRYHAAPPFLHMSSALGAEGQRIASITLFCCLLVPCYSPIFAFFYVWCHTAKNAIRGGGVVKSTIWALVG